MSRSLKQAGTAINGAIGAVMFHLLQLCVALPLILNEQLVVHLKQRSIELVTILYVLLRNQVVCLL